jgi:hypothetical protein
VSGGPASQAQRGLVLLKVDLPREVEGRKVPGCVLLQWSHIIEIVVCIEHAEVNTNPV